MARPPFVNSLLVGSIAIATVATAIAPPGRAQTRGFYCGTSSHPTTREAVPTTIARTDQGEVPMIRWISTWASGSGWTPERRCEEVSARFQTFYTNGTLRYMRTGTINNYPVICIADREGGECAQNAVLVTLEQGSNSREALTQMTQVRDRATVMELSEDLLFYSDGELYVDVEEFLEGGPMPDSSAAERPTSPPAPRPAPPASRPPSDSDKPPLWN